MKEHPIIMRCDEVRAILAGSKTQVRRVVKNHTRSPNMVFLDYGSGWWPFKSNDGESAVMDDGCEHPLNCPFGRPGGQLWVRESFAWYGCERLLDEIIWRAEEPDGAPPHEGFGQWRPPLYMPRWASRITLEVTGVRVEQLQDITPADATAEGYSSPAGTRYAQEELAALDWFRRQWDSINKATPWVANPWVWVIEFKRLEGQS